MVKQFRNFLLAILSLAALSVTAHAQTVVVTDCGTLSPNYAAGNTGRAYAIDVNGNLCNVTGNSQISSTTATIANAASLSGAVDLARGRLANIVMPAAWTAASLTFQTSPDGVTYTDLYDGAGTEYTIAAAASHSIIIPLSDFIGVRYLKVRSGTAGAAVAQGAARALTLVLVN